MKTNKENWKRLSKLVEEEHIADFFVNMVLYISMRQQNIPENERTEINFSENEISVVEELWEMDFISKKSPAYYYKLMNAFVDSIFSYSPKILGIVFETIFSLSNERSRMKSFLILVMGFAYIKKEDFSTAKELLDNFPEYSVKNWLVGVNLLKLELIEKNEIKEDPFKIYDWILEFFDARKDEFLAFKIDQGKIVLKKSLLELKMGFPKKSFVTLKESSLIYEKEEQNNVYQTASKIADYFTENGDIDEAILILEWLINHDFKGNIREKIIFDTGRFYRALASKSNSDKAQKYLEKAESLFVKLEEEFPQSEYLKKIGNRLLRKKNIEDINSKDIYKELIWIFFLDLWIMLLISFFIKLSPMLLIIGFLCIFAVIYIIFKKYIKQWFFGEEY